jgi:hypothetical protein
MVHRVSVFYRFFGANENMKGTGELGGLCVEGRLILKWFQKK